MVFPLNLDTSLYLKNKSTFSQGNVVNLILLNELNLIKAEQNEVKVHKLFISEFKYRTNFFVMSKKFCLRKRKLFMRKRLDSYKTYAFNNSISSGGNRKFLIPIISLGYLVAIKLIIIYRFKRRLF